MDSNWYGRQGKLCTTNWVWNNIHLDHPFPQKGCLGSFWKYLGASRPSLIDSLCSLLPDFSGSCLVMIWCFYLKCYSVEFASFISWEHSIIVKAAQEDDKLVFHKLRSFKSAYLIKLGYKLQCEISRCFEAKPILAVFHLSRKKSGLIDDQ